MKIISLVKGTLILFVGLGLNGALSIPQRNLNADANDVKFETYERVNLRRTRSDENEPIPLEVLKSKKVDAALINSLGSVDLNGGGGVNERKRRDEAEADMHAKRAEYDAIEAAAETAGAEAENIATAIEIEDAEESLHDNGHKVHHNKYEDNSITFEESDNGDSVVVVSDDLRENAHTYHTHGHNSGNEHHETHSNEHHAHDSHNNAHSTHGHDAHEQIHHAHHSEDSSKEHGENHGVSEFDMSGMDKNHHVESHAHESSAPDISHHVSEHVEEKLHDTFHTHHGHEQVDDYGQGHHVEQTEEHGHNEHNGHHEQHEHNLGHETHEDHAENEADSSEVEEERRSETESDYGGMNDVSDEIIQNLDLNHEDVATPVKKLLSESSDLAKEIRLVFQVLARREDYLVKQMEKLKFALQNAIQVLEESNKVAKARKKRDSDQNPYKACVYINPPSQEQPTVNFAPPESLIQPNPPQEIENIPLSYNYTGNEEDIDLSNVYWLKLAQSEDDGVLEKVHKVLTSVGGSGRDVLIIPVTKGYLSSEDVANGFLKAVRVNPAKAQDEISKKRRKRLRLKIRRI